MARRFSILSEPEDAVWRVYRIWRECRRLEASGHTRRDVSLACYERLTALFADGDDAQEDTRRARASAADTQPIDNVDDLTTTTPPPAVV